MLYRFVYGALIVFLVVVIERVARLATLPVHLRWELYPVAHEENARYGGSFFEHLDWWKRKRNTSMLGELKVMVPEIVLLKAVHEHNRSLWYRSFPFHFGLYLMALFVALLVGGGVAQAFGVEIGASAPSIGLALHWATKVVGFAALGLMGLGALGLLVRRLTDPTLRAFSATADYFNLLVFIALAVVGLVASITSDVDFVELRRFTQSLATVHLDAPAPGGWVGAEIAMASAVLAYIPATHMSHFFTKWFMYHSVRWDDRVNTVGSPLEGRIVSQLGYKVDWSAAHIQGGNRKSWVDVATEKPEPKP
ncbi:MAG: respiratory nitrate reductase subunit gamma [Deltaproteobacteria bacterium]|nr:respiratory nitrate reductase subunit gamma [Deltaproteobacteria bacterium]